MTAILDSSLTGVSANVVPPCPHLNSSSDTAEDTSGNLLMRTNMQSYFPNRRRGFPWIPLGRLLSAKAKRLQPKAEALNRGNLALGNKQTLPWSCEESTFWRDLGPGYHPRFVKEVSCKQKTCWFGHFKCKPRHSTVKILHKMAAGSDHKCPNLDKKWRLKDITITLYCECGR